jgi:hypothetical protein
MASDGPPRAEPTESAEESAERASLLRHRRVPNRVVGDTVIAARPRDGAPVTMTSAAALAWHQLDDWTTPAAIDVRLADAFPEVPTKERVAARNEILRTLRNDDLLERH